MCSFRRGGALVAVLLVLSAGCATDGVEPEQWAADVCRALKPWTQEISTLTEDAQAQMSKANSARDAKNSVVGLLRGAEDASEDARHGVKTAGVPAVDDGDRIAGRFVTALEGARDAYGTARQRVESLPVDSADAFYDGVVDAMRRLASDYDNSALDTSNLASEELQQAFDESPHCR